MRCAGIVISASQSSNTKMAGNCPKRILHFVLTEGEAFRPIKRNGNCKKQLNFSVNGFVVEIESDQRRNSGWLQRQKISNAGLGDSLTFGLAAQVRKPPATVASQWLVCCTPTAAL
jgi:hypothetical protein